MANWNLKASANIAVSGEATTALLTAPATKTTGDFAAGRMQDDENPADSINLAADEYTEYEWCIEADPTAERVPYSFRVTVAGVVLDTYTVTPQASVMTFITVATQTELGETNSASAEVPSQLVSTQTENSEIDSANVDSTPSTAITSAQIELSETNSASLNNILEFAASQTEAAETNSATLNNLSIITASQSELSEVSSSSLLANTNVTAAQTETSESQNASIINIGDFFVLSASANIAPSGEVTTAQLTPPSGKTTGDFIAGRMQDDENPADSIDLGVNQYTEYEWSIVPTPSAGFESYSFRVTIEGVPLDTYSITPQLSTDVIASLTNPAQTELSEAQTSALEVKEAHTITSIQTEASEINDATLLQSGTTESFFTVDWIDLDASSPFTNPIYSDIEIGDSFRHSEFTRNDTRTVTMSGDGIISLSGGILPEDQFFDGYIFDVSDGTSGTQSEFTVDAGAFISAPQIETSAADNAALIVFDGVSLSNVSGSQIEASEINGAFIGAPTSISADQTENSEVNSAAINNLANILITGSQAENAEINFAVLGNLFLLTAAQTEASETQSAAVFPVRPREIIADQQENFELNDVHISTAVLSDYDVTPITLALNTDILMELRF